MAVGCLVDLREERGKGISQRPCALSGIDRYVWMNEPRKSDMVLMDMGHDHRIYIRTASGIQTSYAGQDARRKQLVYRRSGDLRVIITGRQR